MPPVTFFPVLVFSQLLQLTGTRVKGLIGRINGKYVISAIYLYVRKVECKVGLHVECISYNYYVNHKESFFTIISSIGLQVLLLA